MRNQPCRARDHGEPAHDACGHTDLPSRAATAPVALMVIARPALSSTALDSISRARILSPSDPPPRVPSPAACRRGGRPACEGGVRIRGRATSATGSGWRCCGLPPWGWRPR
jgi:hypothetical protein